MTWTWLGIAALALLLFSCYRGYQRGLIKEVVSLLCVILSMTVVWFINPYVNQFIRENTSVYERIQESCREFVEDNVGEMEGAGDAQQEVAINNMDLPGLLTEGIKQNNTAEVYTYLAVSTFSDYISEYLALMAVNGLSFLVSFLLASILIRSITWALNLIARLPVLKGINKLAGAFLSAAKFVIFLWVIFLGLTVLCNTQLGEQGLKMIKQDYVLSYLYDKDVLIQIFMSIFYGK